MRILTPTLLALATLVGCAKSPQTPALEAAMAQGARVRVAVTEAADGSLVASDVVVEPPAAGCEDDDAETDDDGIEDGTDDGETDDDATDDPCDDGETDDDGIEDGTDDGETDDDGIEDGTDDGETDDDGIEDGTDDGETDDDADGDGDVDQEDAAYDTSAGSPATLTGTPVYDAGRGIYRLLGLDVNPGPHAVPEGVVRFEGRYDAGYLSTTAVTGATSGGAVLAGISEGVVANPDGSFVVKLLGREVLVGANTPTRTVADPLVADDGEIAD